MYNYRLKNCRKISPSCFELEIVPSKTGDVIDFRAGQYLAISANTSTGKRRSTYRCFSVASAPGQSDGSICIGIRLGSKYTKSLAKLNPGSEISIEGPFGEFTPNLSASNPLVLIAGGIGVTPMMSILQDASLNGSNREIQLLFFNRRQTDIPYLESLKMLSDSRGLGVKVFVDEEVKPDAFVKRGCLDAKTLKEVFYTGAEYYLCGPAGFMAKASKILETGGVSKNAVISESFGSSNKAVGKKFSVSKLAYTASALLIVLGVVGIASHDLVEKELNSLSSEESKDENNSTSGTQSQQNPSENNTVTTPSTNNSKKNNYQAPRSTVS